MGVPYQWMICSGASYQNWLSRGTPILGNHHMFKLPCMIVVVHGVCPSKGNQFGHSINTSPLTVNRDSQIPIFGNQKCGVPFQLVIYTSDTLKISPLLVNQGLFIRGELLTSRIILQWPFPLFLIFAALTSQHELPTSTGSKDNWSSFSNQRRQALSIQSKMGMSNVDEIWDIS